MIACKVDDNQRDIVKKLRKIPGVTVFITSSIGDGFPDIVVGYKRVNYLFEIKDGSKPPSRRKLTPAEEKFHDLWTGRVDICNSFEEVIKVLNIKS